MSDIKLEEIVLSEINLTHKSLDEGVQHLIGWIQKQPHLPDVTDENFLKAFIVGSKSVEKAKKRLDKYFTVKTKYPKCFYQRDPFEIKWPMIEKILRLPGLTPDGLTVYFVIPPTEKNDVELYDCNETIKVFFMQIDRLLRSLPIVGGHYVVYDCKNLGLEFVTKTMTTFTPAAINIYQGCLPIRIKGMICFNASTAAEVLCNNILKAFLSEKLRDKVQAHSEDHKILAKYFPLDLLPEDYGGKAPSVKQLLDWTRKDLESDRDWFRNEGNQRADESKRPKENNDSENVQGTFRKLNID